MKANVFTASLLLMVLTVFSSKGTCLTFEEAQSQKENQAKTGQAVVTQAEKEEKLKIAEEKERQGYIAYVPKALKRLEKAIQDRKSLYPPNEEDLIMFDLAKAKDARAVPYLIKILKDYPVTSARVDAAMALGEIGDRTAIPALKDALEDKDYQVKTEAAVTLVKFGENQAAFPTLKKVAQKGKY